MVIEADTARELRELIVGFLDGRADKSREIGDTRATIAWRREWYAVERAYRDASAVIAAMVIKPKNGGDP